MAILVNDFGGARREVIEGWTPDIALKHAWFWWLGVMAMPAIAFVFMLWRFVDRTDDPNIGMSWKWFTGVVIYMIVAVPGAIMLRSRMWGGYWRGERIAPKKYLLGMLAVWVPIVLGGLLSLAGCVLSRTMLPNLFVALVAFVLFLTMWPSGKGMLAGHKGGSDDPEKYEEPR